MKRLLLLLLSLSSVSLWAMTHILVRSYTGSSGYSVRDDLEHFVSFFSSSADKDKQICVEPWVKNSIKSNPDWRYPIMKKELDQVIELIDKYKKSGLVGWFRRNSELPNVLKNTKDLYAHNWPHIHDPKWADRGILQKMEFEVFMYRAYLLVWAQKQEDGNPFSKLPLELLVPILKSVKPEHEEFLKFNICKRYSVLFKEQLQTELDPDSSLSDGQIVKLASQMFSSNNYTVYLKPEALLYLAKNLPPGKWRKKKKSYGKKVYQWEMTIDDQKYTFASVINPYLYGIDKQSNY